MNSTSVSLLQRAKEDPNGSSWHEFFDLYASLIDGWLRRRGLQSQDVEDVRQEVMGVVIRELPRFDHNGRTGAFRRWLRMTTANRLRQFWRTKQHGTGQTEVNLADMADQLEDANSELSHCWKQEHDRFILDKLLAQIRGEFKPKTVAAFQKLAVHGQDAAEVAKDLEMTVNAVRIAQSRVMRSLRQMADELLD